jgi:hypothetical protein
VIIFFSLRASNTNVSVKIVKSPRTSSIVTRMERNKGNSVTRMERNKGSSVTTCGIIRTIKDLTIITKWQGEFFVEIHSHASKLDDFCGLQDVYACDCKSH